MSADERVLVIPTDRFLAAGDFHGFRPADEAYRSAILDPAGFAFRPRGEVETDPGFKQLIPYVVLTRRGEVFHYRRGAAGTEARLRSLRSVGLGGHVSEDDARGGDDPYHAGMMRELAEEVAVECGWVGSFLGFIHDARTPVGRVHLGVVHRFELDAPAVRPLEAAIADPGFAPVADLSSRAGEFETWSQFVLAELARR